MFFMVALFLFSLSGQAMAYFENGHLIRVIYDRGGTKEIVTDLGAGWDLTSPTTVHQLFNTNTFSLTDLGISSWNNVYVAYFAFNVLNPIEGTQNRAWTSGPEAGQANLARQWTNFSNGALGISGSNYQSGVAQNINNQAAGNSYASKYGTIGRFAGFLPAPGTGDQNLSDLATVGYVDQWIYYYASPNSAASGTKLFKIRTKENGTTDINPVPIPPTVYLLGSGLLGLIGIRRRMTA